MQIMPPIPKYFAFEIQGYSVGSNTLLFGPITARKQRLFLTRSFALFHAPIGYGTCVVNVNIEYRQLGRALSQNPASLPGSHVHASTLLPHELLDETPDPV